MILHEAFDVILLDIAMPGIDGLEILRRTRAKGVAQNTLRGGAFDYVAKPFDFAYLAQALAAAVVYRGRTGDATDASPQRGSDG
jgi:CheY-like chemotaxis protein